MQMIGHNLNSRNNWLRAGRVQMLTPVNNDELVDSKGF
jgi:hypothetical protein